MRYHYQKSCGQPFYPLKKLANWWLIVGDTSRCQLLVIKHITVTKSFAVKLEFSLPKGTHSLELYITSDSYVGADHDITLNPIDVAEDNDSDICDLYFVSSSLSSSTHGDSFCVW